MPTDPPILRPSDDAERIAVVRSLGLLETSREERFDKVARVLAAVLDVPVAFVSLLDEQRLVYKGYHGKSSTGDAERDLGFCAHAVVAGRLLIVPDLAADQRFRSSRQVVDQGFRFYAGQPLRVRGHVVGTLCALDRRPRQLEDRQRDLLADLAAWAEGELVAVEVGEMLDRERAGASLLAAVQERDELILQFADQAVFGIDPEGFVSFANPAAARLLHEDLEDLVGRNFHDNYHSRRPDGAPYPWQECPTRDVLTAGVVRRVAPDLMHRRDGTPIDVEFAAAPLVVDGEVAGAVVTVSDISSRRAVERLKDEFVAVVSHELRTPLTSIRGSLGLLASGRFGELPAQGARLVDIALSNTDRLVRLVNDILDLERIEAGRLEVALRRQALGPLLHAACDAVAGTAEEAGVGVVVNLDADDLDAEVDADLFVRAVTNLVGNAVKFSPRGQTVDVVARRLGDRVVVDVRDTGRGIPPEKLGRIFERFEQVDASDARVKGGTGLGLPITRSIVEKHGGRVTVTSQPGAGSTFTVSLPAPPAKGGGVLLVEDDADLVEVLTAALEPLGVQVSAAASVDAAVAAVQEGKPTVVVLDVELDGGQGFEVVAQLRRDPRSARTPVVVATVHELDPEQRARLVLGPTRFLRKGAAGADVVGEVVSAVREHFAADAA